jgi:ribosomal protein L10
MIEIGKNKLFNVSLSDPHVSDNCKTKILNYTVGSMMCSTCLDNSNDIVDAFKNFINVVESHHDKIMSGYQEYRDTLVPVV